MDFKVDHLAIVLGMTETGLGVARSLGRKGIKVLGLDFKKDIGFYSRYVKGFICPHPLETEKKFIDYLIKLGNQFDSKPVLFITSDDFLVVVSKNRDLLNEHYLFNIPKASLLDSIINKYSQFDLASKADIGVPTTFVPQHPGKAIEMATGLRFPAFVKAIDVNTWRKSISGTVKGFIASNQEELLEILESLSKQNVKSIVQEVVQGPDTNHFKVCCYFSEKGALLLSFTLQKLRQNPVRFGVGSLVKSVCCPELLEIGKDLFRKIGYQGVGSAEFKLDERDHRLKLIEINPRYWQQNALAERCGLNFPLVNYLDVTEQNVRAQESFETNIKWLNIYMDFDSFSAYRREGSITFPQWLRSIRGKKVYSDIATDDIVPSFYEVGFGWKFLKAPRYLLNRLK